MIRSALQSTSLAASLFSMLILSPTTTAKENTPTSKTAEQAKAMVSADRLLELSTPTPDSLRMEGEQSLRFGNLERALACLQKSVEMAPSDIDGRILFAQALEKKLQLKKERDPAIYNLLVKQWVFVVKKSQVDDQTSLGRSHLRSLTGTLPHKFETMNGFIARASMPEEQASNEKTVEHGSQVASKNKGGGSL